MAVSNGTYRLSTAMNETSVIDVNGISKSNGANVTLHHINGGNNQIFFWNGTNVIFAHSKKVMDMQGYTEPRAGVNVAQHESNGGNNQKWNFAATGETHTINGQTLPIYFCEAKTNSSLCLDAYGESSKDGTNIFLHTKHGGINQKWILQKDSFFNDKLAVPAKVGVSDSVGGELKDVVALNSDEALYPCWVSSDNSFQLRYKYRSRSADSSSFGEWSNWKSPSSSTNDEGWGDAWSANVTDERDGSLRYITSGLSAELDALSGDDAKEYQIEVRQFDNNTYNDYFAGAHGNSNTGVVKVFWRPTISCESVVYGFGGLLVPYEVDQTKPLRYIEISGVKIDGVEALYDSYVIEQPLSSGTLSIPLNYLSAVPEDGSGITIDFRLVTNDSVVSESSYTDTVNYSGSHGLSLNVSQDSYRGYGVKVDFGSSYDSSYVLMVYEGLNGKKEVSECKRIDGQTFIVFPPFNKDYSIIVSAKNNNGSWAVDRLDGFIVENSYPVFNFANEYIEANRFSSFSGGFSASFKADYEKYQTNSRKYESIFFSDSFSASLSIEILVESFAELEKVRRMIEEHYAIFRDNYGQVFDVAIMSHDESRVGRNEWLVSIEMRERS